MAEKVPDWFEKIIEKGGDVGACLAYLRERSEKEESLRLKEIDREEKIRHEVNEREERAAERAEKAAERDVVEKEKDRQLKMLQLEHEIRLKEIELKSKEINISSSKAAAVKAKVSLPKFAEGQDIEVFLTSFERLAELHKWDKSEWPIRLIPQLTGNALEAYSRMSLDESKSYDKIKKAILERYGLNPLEYRTKFRYSKQNTNETFKEYAIRIANYFSHWQESELVNNIYENIVDMIIRDQLMTNCMHDLQIYLLEKEPKSVQELVTLASAYQVAHSGKDTKQPIYRPPMFKHKENTQQNAEYPPGAFGYNTPSYKSFEKRKCFHCRSEDHLIAQCPLKGNLDNGTHSKDKSYSYGKQANGLIHSPTKVTKACYMSEIPVQKHVIGVGETDQLTDGLMLSEGKVGTEKVTILRDTGCTTIFVADRLKHLGSLTGCYQVVTLANGAACRCPEVVIDIETSFISGNVKALVMDNPFAELVVGNIGHLVGVNELNTFQGIETRAMKTKRVFNEEIQKKVEDEIILQKEVQKVSETTNIQNTDDYEYLAINRAELKDEQKKDKSLDKVRSYAEENHNQNVEEIEPGGKNSYFTFHDRILYRVYNSKGRDPIKQIVVPTKYRKRMMEIAHNVPLGGHLGNRKTRNRILQNFFWPGIFIDVAHHCRACPNCQKSVPKGRVARAPLIPIPAMEEPFNRMAIDIVGPLNRTERGNRFILVTCDYGTKYPEAIPLKTIDAQTVANALVDIFARTGLPNELLSDQGSNFVSSLMQNLCKLLHIRKMKTSPYHPQANGLVERFNGTLKKMLKCYAQEEEGKWDLDLPYLLFAYREVPQESTGYSPFEILYGRHVRGPLTILREEWEEPNKDKLSESTISYILKTRERLVNMTNIAQESENVQKQRQKKYFDRKARYRTLIAGEKVLILLPTNTNKILAQWKGPFEVVEKVSPVDYKIKMNQRTTKIFHINMLKKWYSDKQRGEEGKTEVETVLETGDNTMNGDVTSKSQISACLIYYKDENKNDEEVDIENPLLTQQESINDIQINENLQDVQKRLLTNLCREFKDVLSDVPGKTGLIEHDVVINCDKPIYKKPYKLPFAMREKVREEILDMVEAGIAEKSSSPWAAPIVVVKKKDDKIRLCVDYRGLNEVTIFDPQPMPKLDDILNKLGKAKFMSKLDCTKGFWQIPLSKSAKEKSAFTTPFGQFQFNVMPFGMVNSAASFVRLMKMVLDGLDDFSDAFIDDILIFSLTFPEHLIHIRQVLESIRKAKITAKPSKCKLGYQELEFLAHKVGNGEVHPSKQKIDAINRIQNPLTKKQVRSFIGTVNFYRRFIPNFAEIAAPLTDLTAKKLSNKVKWEECHQHAFDKLKEAITSYPILRNPDFAKGFILQTDASDRGIGGVLLQREGKERFPIMYISKKLLKAEEAYSTVEKECLAIVKSVITLREYLLGKEFSIESDHFPLQWLNKMKDQNMRLMRWSLMLQEYRFTIVHITGKKNTIADMLSRWVDN